MAQGDIDPVRGVELEDGTRLDATRVIGADGRASFVARVAGALAGADPALEGYEAWRDARAAGHYEWSFQFGSMPRPETAGPLFDGMSGDPAAEQDFRDVLCRTVNPRELLSKERLERWFAHAEAPAG